MVCLKLFLRIWDFFINCYEAQKIYTAQETSNNLIKSFRENMEESNYPNDINNMNSYDNLNDNALNKDNGNNFNRRSNEKNNKNIKKSNRYGLEINNNKISNNK